MRLIADVGGTNTRMALAEGGAVQVDSLRNFRNAEHGSFDEVMRQFLDTAGVPVDEIVVAVAGPVGPGHARLTNHDWDFDAAAMRDRFGASHAALVNDLKALGHALPALDDDGLIPVAHTGAGRRRGTQSLVAGIGTGFNVSPVLWTAPGVAQCLRSEHGHLTLPEDIRTALDARVGPAADEFTTIESCFSGAGLGKVLTAMTGLPADRPETLVARDDPKVQAALQFYAGLIGRLARNLKLAFMPDAGLFFAGSVARAILTSQAKEAFLETFDAPIPLEFDLVTPVWIIKDDSAALKGCAQLDAAQEE